MLTRKQHELLMFIDRHLEETGFSPSFDEMKTALDLKSKSGIHRLITALEERGFLRRRAHRARALEVVRRPGSAAPPRIEMNEEASPNVVQGNFGRPAKQDKPNAITLPLFGRIAAGSPIEALRDQGQGVDVPVGMLGSGEHYALEVAGDSMIEAGILDGDTVVIQRGDSAENGDIVVALVDENEVTLKRLRRRGNSVALEPANRNHETRIFGPDRVQVQGRLVGLIRSY
ncbi:transcriptional repressor LexA [Roseococcus pinisoli]|uniref:LexA repressor n=1 Tax=Roseococcus pinisoli TaxID=2835040 RepID=A0ABS5QHZ6_9PROT|nr:transcriptional repressor LexA [Roseococcus pinisoli]MBS7812542.1 transcriptional repressor LexA [Roseococcus pinisoli]